MGGPKHDGQANGRGVKHACHGGIPSSASQDRRYSLNEAGRTLRSIGRTASGPVLTRRGDRTASVDYSSASVICKHLGAGQKESVVEKVQRSLPVGVC